MGGPKPGITNVVHTRIVGDLKEPRGHGAALVAVHASESAGEDQTCKVLCLCRLRDAPQAVRVDAREIACVQWRKFCWIGTCLGEDLRLIYSLSDEHPFSLMRHHHLSPSQPVHAYSFTE
jgi:hypothetical protein